uniref:Retrotransposon gag protein n=1 Tax=Asparagus officinalis TaxID=4686 RepID=Q2AA72_ASPOF|nr:Retrotransposon gag protein [Asparagus officinalis]
MISGNEALMVRSLVSILRGPAFDWYRRLKPGSINCWDDMESLFLSNFFDDDTEVSIGTLLDEKQKDGESVDNFVKRFRNKAMNCRDPITEEFILQTCHNNLSIDVLEALGVVPSKTWKDLKMRGEQAEHFLKRKKAERPTDDICNRWERDSRSEVSKGVFF